MNASGILLVSDLDGTLLTSDKQISQNTLAALEKLREQGGRFTIATGRSVVSTRQFLGKLRPDVPAILFNGAAIYDYRQDRMLWHASLPESARDCLRAVQENFPQVGIEILREDQTYVVSYNEIVGAHLEIEHLPYQKAQLDQVPSGWIKVLFDLEHDLIPEFAAFLNRRNQPGVQYVESSEYYYEMLPAGCSKGDALPKLSQLCGIPLERMAAVGDYNNDLEMIRCAGIGAAMGNALDRLKQQADLVVADNDHDGVAQLIEWILSRNT